MNVVTATVVIGVAVFLVVSAIVHRVLPPSWLLETQLRRLPSTPAIIDRVVGARRKQVLWSALIGLACLGVGVLVVAAEWSRATPDRWRPGISLLYFALFGSIAGSLIGLARDGYAFADRNGPRVAQSRRRPLRSLVGIWSLLVSHLCVAITTVTTLSLLLSPGGRSALSDPDALQPADTLIFVTLAVVILVISDVAIVWINRLPSSASTDLELVWDAAVKATTAQRLLTYAPGAAGSATLLLYDTFFHELDHVQIAALVIVYVLWMADMFLPMHLPAKPRTPLTDERAQS